MEERTLKVGLLVEAAHAQQALAERVLARLEGNISDLDSVVRDAVRRALSEELQGLTQEGQRAQLALRSIAGAASLRLALWNIGITFLCTVIPLCAFMWLVPTQGELAQLRAKREELIQSVARLEERGGLVDLRRCGGSNRLCVRVDRKAPAYGTTGDYLVVKGY